MSIRKTKTIVIKLLSGKSKRITKSEISSIEEQYNINGNLDVEVWIKSGCRYLTMIPKKYLNKKYGGRRECGNYRGQNFFR